jgi:hypothetical protein
MFKDEEAAWSKEGKGGWSEVIGGLCMCNPSLQLFIDFFISQSKNLNLKVKNFKVKNKIKDAKAVLHS